MNVKSYLTSMTRAERASFAAKCGTTLAYLEQLRCGAKKPGPQMSRRIFSESAGQVALHELRPDIWPFERRA